MHHLDLSPTPSRRPTGARRRARSTLAAVGLVGLGALAAACSGSGEGATTASTSSTTTSGSPRSSSTTTTTADGTTTTEPDYLTEADCVPDDEVATVVGGQVDLTVSFGGSSGEIGYSYEGCSYDVVGTEGSVGIVRLSNDGLDGAELYDALEAAAAASSDEDGFEQIDDLGDEAYRDGRKLVVLHGPQVLLLAYSPTGDSDDRNPDKALRVALAVLPIDLSGKPIDCDAVGAALVDEFGPVASTMPGGGVDAVNDASLEYQNCTITFDDGGEADVGVADAAPFAEWVAGKKDSVFSTTFEATSVGELRAFDNGDELFVDDGAQPLRVSSDDLDLGDEEAAELRLSLAELAVGS